MKKRIAHTCRENKGFILFIALMFIMRSVFADWNHVPSGSMKPTLLEGDHIFVNKMAYDIRVPFTHLSLIKLDEPERGDIIIFDSAVSDKRLVKRVIGIGGDQVALLNNRLWINGQALEYTPISISGASQDLQEDLLGSTHAMRVGRPSGMAGFDAVTVPTDHFLVLGDNRDNSADSRVIGFVPRDEIVGEAKSVILSLNYENYYLPRPKRFFHRLL